MDGPYGAQTLLNSSWTGISDTYTWIYGFQGGRYDSYAGLYNFQRREYDPTLGRWMQQDPAGYVDGKNLYRALTDSPVDFVDPFGLQTQPAGGGLPTPQPAGLNQYSNVPGQPAGWQLYSKLPPDLFGAFNSEVFSTRDAASLAFENLIEADPIARATAKLINKFVQDNTIPASPEVKNRLKTALYDTRIRLEPHDRITLKVGQTTTVRVLVYVSDPPPETLRYQVKISVSGDADVLDIDPMSISGIWPEDVNDTHEITLKGKSAGTVMLTAELNGKTAVGPQAKYSGIVSSAALTVCVK
jgi:RHS repeat-associated protein